LIIKKKEKGQARAPPFSTFVVVKRGEKKKKTRALAPRKREAARGETNIPLIQFVQGAPGKKKEEKKGKGDGFMALRGCIPERKGEVRKT